MRPRALTGTPWALARGPDASAAITACRGSPQARRRPIRTPQPGPSLSNRPPAAGLQCRSGQVPASALLIAASHCGYFAANSGKVITCQADRLAARSPKPPKALARAKKAGYAYVVIDGTLIL